MKMFSVKSIRSTFSADLSRSSNYTQERLYIKFCVGCSGKGSEVKGNCFWSVDLKWKCENIVNLNRRCESGFVSPQATKRKMVKIPLLMRINKICFGILINNGDIL